MDEDSPLRITYLEIRQPGLLSVVRSVISCGHTPSAGTVGYVGLTALVTVKYTVSLGWFFVVLPFELKYSKNIHRALGRGIST